MEGVKGVVRRLVEDRQPNEWENHWITKDGERRLIRWSNTILCDGNGDVAYVLGTGIDITERRRAEQKCDRLLLEERRARAAAEQAESRAAFLANAAHVLAGAFEDPAQVLHQLARLAVPYLASWCAVRIVDDQGVVTTPVFTHMDARKQARLTKLGARVFRLPTAQALPAAVVGGQSMLVDGGHACLAHFSAAFSGIPEGTRRRAAAILRDAGMASLMMVPLAARGRLFGAMVFVSADERCSYGPAHLVLAEALAARAALALDNARLYETVRRALQAREDFLVIASHELQTPLTSLQMAVQALARRSRAAGGAAPHDLPLLEAVERSTARLGTLVGDLLDIAHFTAEPPTPDLRDVDLRPIVLDALECSRDALQRARCAVSHHVEGPTDGLWDRGWLVQIVRHLISNAAKYGGGPSVTYSQNVLHAAE